MKNRWVNTGLFVMLMAAVAIGAPPRGTVAVRPITSPARSEPALRIARGSHFRYALPAGWRVGEEGPFAVLLVAPDNRAFTLMVGLSGLPIGYPLDRFVRERFAAIQPQNFEISAPQQVPARAGFRYSVAYEYRYISARGLPSRGVVICSVAPAYDSQLVVMNAAASVESQWQEYVRWLPLTAEQIAAVDGSAFGQRAVMAQNLENSRRFGEAQQAYRDWSSRLARETADQRDAVQDRQQREVRENLGNGLAYTNPYEGSREVQMPSTYQYYWVNRRGEYVGSNDPSVNPNAGSTDEWRPMPRQHP